MSATVMSSKIVEVTLSAHVFGVPEIYVEEGDKKDEGTERLFLKREFFKSEALLSMMLPVHIFWDCSPSFPKRKRVTISYIGSVRPHTSEASGLIG